MIIVKWIILLLVLLVCSLLGVVIANSYKERVNDLKKIKVALNILKTKIEYTYEPLPEIFLSLSKEFQGGIRKDF